MPEPWPTIIALVVGLPLCFAALALGAAFLLGLLIAPYVPDMEDEL
jgi:hypothetical protein